MRNRWTKVSALAMTLCLVAGCSSSPLDGVNLSSLNPFDSSCDTCAVDPCAPEPDPCAPTPDPCDPCATPVAVQQQPGRPDAKPGEVWCYIRVPAVTETVTENVCVQPATIRKVWVPPVQEEIEEQVCTCEAQVVTETIPAKFKDEVEQYCVAPAKTEWRRVECEPTSLGAKEQVGECWTIVEIPAQYETRTRRVCIQQAQCVQRTIPAKYAMQKRLVTTCAGYYKDVEVPAVYETKTREVQVCGPRWEWRRTHECEVPAESGGMAPIEDAAPAGIGSPDAEALPPAADDNLPPAGELPPLDPLAPDGE